MPKKKIIEWILHVTKSEKVFFDKLNNKARLVSIDDKEETRVGIPRNESENIDFAPWAKDEEQAAVFLDVYERLLKAKLLKVVADEAPNGTVPHSIVEYDRWMISEMTEIRPTRFSRGSILKAIRLFQTTAMRQIIPDMNTWHQDRKIFDRFGVSYDTFRTTVCQHTEIYPLAREVAKGNVWVAIVGFEIIDFKPNRTQNGEPTDRKRKKRKDAGKKVIQKGGKVVGKRKGADDATLSKILPDPLLELETSPGVVDVSQQILDMAAEIDQREQAWSAEGLALKQLKVELEQLKVKNKTALRARLASLEAERKALQKALRE